jgi:hypothetical protein
MKVTNKLAINFSENHCLFFYLPLHNSLDTRMFEILFQAEIQIFQFGKSNVYGHFPLHFFCPQTERAPRCNREGSLTTMKTKSKGRTYQYWYVEHHIGKKIKWCYLGKYKKLPDEFKKLIHKNTQTSTQNNSRSEKLNSSSFLETSSY